MALCGAMKFMVFVPFSRISEIYVKFAKSSCGNYVVLSGAMKSVLFSVFLQFSKNLRNLGKTAVALYGAMKSVSFFFRSIFH